MFPDVYDLHISFRTNGGVAKKLIVPLGSDDARGWLTRCAEHIAIAEMVSLVPKAHFTQYPAVHVVLPEGTRMHYFIRTMGQIRRNGGDVVWERKTVNIGYKTPENKFVGTAIDTNGVVVLGQEQLEDE